MRPHHYIRPSRRRAYGAPRRRSTFSSILIGFFIALFFLLVMQLAAEDAQRQLRYAEYVVSQYGDRLRTPR